MRSDLAIDFIASSPVFSSILYNKSIQGEGRNGTTVLDIDDGVEAKTVEEMLRYIYTGSIGSLGESADKLILLAYKYVLPDLKRLCEAAILSRVTGKNAMEVYRLGKEVMSARLTSKAFGIMKA
jgi:hypothetical protein